MSNEDFARNPKTPPEALAMLSTSPSAAVRVLVAQNPSTPRAALRFLAQDEVKEVREAVAQNPMTPYDAFSGKEAAPLPVEHPLTADNVLNEQAQQVNVQEVNKEVSTEAEPVAANFVPAEQVQRPLSLWQRFLALLGLQRA